MDLHHSFQGPPSCVTKSLSKNQHGSIKPGLSIEKKLLKRVLGGFLSQIYLNDFHLHSQLPYLNISSPKSQELSFF
jgi:hypothetical protein